MGLKDLDYIINITCPKCGHQMSELVSWFNADGNACTCGQTFRVSEESLRGGIAETNRQIANAIKEISPIKIKIEI